MRLIYLGTPYHDRDPGVRVLRRGAAAAVLAHFFHEAQDICLHSPVVHWGPVADLFNLPHDFDVWQKQDFFLISKSAAMWVLPLEGWRQSYGLGLELEYCADLGRDIFYVQTSLPESQGFHLIEDKDSVKDLSVREVFRSSPHWSQTVPTAPPTDGID